MNYRECLWSGACAGREPAFVSAEGGLGIFPAKQTTQ